MENNFFSLIYPSEEKKNADISGSCRVNISEAVCDEIGLTDMLSLRSGNISDYFTRDREVIEYRQKTILDLKKVPALSDALRELVPILCDILELRRLSADMHTASDSYLYSITEIELYISAVDMLSNTFGSVGDELKSPAFLSLAKQITDLSSSEYYKELNEKLKKLSSRVREIRSITVGVNLDRQMRPTDAGVISVNSEEFKSGKTLDKILRMSFKNDAFTCIAQLSDFGSEGSSQNEKDAMAGTFRHALDDVFRRSVSDWRKICGDYVLDNTDFLLRILPEIEFVQRASQLIGKLEERGYTCVIPEILDECEKGFSAKELYNPSVALRIDDRVVDNDFAFDDNGRIFILSGPNRGGKSVITCAVGLCQAMFQLGMPVAAKSARISPTDAIFTHFPEGADDTIDKGRLGEECARLYEIFEGVTDKSMILLDESLSSTGAYEASYIASEILAGFAAAGCRGIFSTHLHELSAHIDEINERSKSKGGVLVDTLVAGIEEGRRSFKIVRKKPDGKSYARDIADKYGLSFDSLAEKLGK